MTVEANTLQRLNAIVEAAPVGMFTTTNPNHELSSRPLFCAGMDVDCLWFVVQRSQLAVHKTALEGRGNVTFSDHAGRRHASVGGRSELVSDGTLLQKLWCPELQTWIPGGLEQEDLVILQVDLDHAEVWN
jgi:general stress protein 26